MSGAVERILPDTNELQVMKSIAKELSESGLLPEAYRKKPASVFLAIQQGKELGLKPMQAINGINVIKGKPTLSPALMAALIMSSGKGAYRVKQFTDEVSEIDFVRNGGTTNFKFTMEDAVKAGLANKDNWRNYPKNMLHARNMSNGARMIFPDVIQGLYTVEEIAPDVEMTEEGIPIEGPIIDIDETQAEQVVEAEIVEEPKTQEPAIIYSEAEKNQLTTMILDLIKWYQDVDFLRTLSIPKRRNYQKVLSDGDGKSVVSRDDLSVESLPSILHIPSVKTWHKGIGKAYDTYDLTKGTSNGK